MMLISINEIHKKERERKKDFGIFFTPEWVVDFMTDLIENPGLNLKDLKILEPACGACQFLLGIKKKRKDLFDRAVKKVGVEINSKVLNSACNLNGVSIIHHDFLLWNTADKYDIIIGNPPYGIPSLSDHYTIKVDNKTKERYKEIFETWYGKYNVYGAFIEKSIKLLKNNGQLIFIVPATFMILDEFKKLRKFLSENGKTEIVYMGSDVFKPEADVTTVVLKFRKSKHEKNKLVLYDYAKDGIRQILKSDFWNGEIILFKSEFSEEVENICSFRLSDLYEIRISPRTPEIKSSKYVIKSSYHESNGLLPILNGRNLKIGEVVYEAITGYWIEPNNKTKLRKFFAKPHIVVGLGFRGDGKLGCAYDHKAYPWMGDVYHLLRKNTLLNMGFDMSEEEVVNFLNSDIVQKYVKEVFRDITYHFSITQLSILPLPTKKELMELKESPIWKEIGKKI